MRPLKSSACGGIPDYDARLDPHCPRTVIQKFNKAQQKRVDRSSAQETNVSYQTLGSNIELLVIKHIMARETYVDKIKSAAVAWRIGRRSHKMRT